MSAKREPVCRTCGRVDGKHTPEGRAEYDAWAIWKPWKKALAPKHPFKAPLSVVQETQMGAVTPDPEQMS